MTDKAVEFASYIKTTLQPILWIVSLVGAVIWYFGEAKLEQYVKQTSAARFAANQEVREKIIDELDEARSRITLLEERQARMSQVDDRIISKVFNVPTGQPKQ